MQVQNEEHAITNNEEGTEGAHLKAYYLVLLVLTLWIHSPYYTITLAYFLSVAKAKDIL